MFHIHLEEYAPGGQSQKHGHVNEAAFYILDGEGYEIHDGIRYDWKAGDVAIVHNNCVHQHFNASATKPARALVMKTKPMFMFMNMLFQKMVEPRPTTPAPGGEGFQAREFETELQPRRVGGTVMAWSESKAWTKGTRQPEALSGAARRCGDGAGAEREAEEDRASRGHAVGDGAPGAAQAPVNEAMNTRMETVDAYMQIIPPGSRSGKHRHLAEECLYVSRGTATTCTRTATSRSPTPTTGSRRTR